jgi:4'-phosphopantetheinyl transferase
MPANAMLPPDLVEIWRVPLDVSDAERRELERLLSEDERRRAAALRLPDSGRRFIAARAAVRLILSARAGDQPSRIRLAAHPGGKPYLSEYPGVHFNLSHTGDACVCAVASQPVGVDIERVRTGRRVMGVARRFFAPEEWEPLARLPAERRLRAFYACWTRKEAYAKALGLGVAVLRRFVVSIEPGAPAVLASSLAGGDPASWRLHDLHDAGDLVGALAAPPSCSRLVERDWRWDVRSLRGGRS